MPMTYGIIRAVTAGQEFTDVWERNEEWYVYDIVHDGGIEHFSKSGTEKIYEELKKSLSD